MSSVSTLSSPARLYRPIVQDLMSTDVFTLLEEDNIQTLEELMKWRRIRHVPVVDIDSALVGLVTHRDFLAIAISRLTQLKAGELGEIYRAIPVHQIMNRNVVSVTPDTTLSDAAELLFSKKYGCLPVVDNGKLVGIITEADFVKAFIERDAFFRTV